MSSILVCIVIYGVNDFIDKTLKCLKQSDCSCELKIVIIDNYETYKDGELKSKIHNLKNVHPGLEYMSTGRNLGYGKAANLAFRHFSGSEYDYFIAMNDDVFVEKDTIRKLIREMKDNRVCLTGPEIMTEQGIKEGPYRFMGILRRYILLPFLPLILLFNKHFFDDRVQQPDDKIYRLNGSFLFFRSSAFEEIGMFDENLFLFGEELVLAERIRARGLKQKYISTIRVIHKHSFTINRTMSLREKENTKLKSILYYYSHILEVHALPIFLARISFCFYLNLYYLPYKWITANKIRKKGSIWPKD